MMNPAEFANIAKAEQSLWWYRGMRKILYRLLDPIAAAMPRARVLEAGCGTGYMAAQLEQRYGWQVVGIDLGWDGLEYGRQRALQRLAQADLSALPFPAYTFDIVTCLDVILHFPRGEEDRPTRELMRVLKPGGVLVLRVPALDVLRSRHSEFTGERQRFTRKQLVRLVGRHGLRLVRVTYANSLLLPVALAKFRVWEPLLNKPPASGIGPIPKWLDRILYVPLALEAAWIGAGANLPIGQSLILIAEKAREAA